MRLLLLVLAAAGLLASCDATEPVVTVDPNGPPIYAP